MYTDKNGRQYYGLDDKPWWWFNLEKAWDSNRKEKGSKNKFDQLMHNIGVPKGMRYHSDEYVRWTLQQDFGSQGMTKRKPGRPKLPPSLRKQSKTKRSEQMKQLLRDNGIEVLEDSTLDTHPDIRFLANGRLSVHGYPISVYQFLQNIDDF